MVFNKKGGRLPQSVRIQIEKKLRNYFQLGISATFAARQLEINIKTACEFYKKFTTEIRSIQSKEFHERNELERAQITQTYDNLIYENNQTLKQIDHEIKQYKKQGRSIHELIDKRQKVIKLSGDLVEKKGHFVTLPTSEDLIRDILKKMGIKVPDV